MKAIILGASGQTGRYIIRQFQKTEDVDTTAFVRTPSKLKDMDLTGIKVAKGDALIIKEKVKL